MEALAGEATALNSLAEWDDLDERNAARGKLSAELAAMIEGVPPGGPDRAARLHKHWGYFTWDADAGRYRSARQE